MINQTLILVLYIKNQGQNRFFVLSNCDYFHYCDSNIVLFSIASIKVFTLIFFASFWYQFFAYFSTCWYCLSNYRNLRSYTDLKLKLCFVWMGTFSLKFLFIIFSKPNLSSIHVYISEIYIANRVFGLQNSLLK